MIVKPQRILWPTDFSELALQGARYAKAFAQQFSAQLHVIHVIPPPMTADVSVTLPTEVPVTFSEEEMLDTCRKRLDEIVATQFDSPDTVTKDVFFGNPWSSICEYAKDHDIDLAVVTTHGRTGLQHVLIGSTAERIVQHAPCPVLVIKHPEKDFVSD